MPAQPLGSPHSGLSVVWATPDRAEGAEKPLAVPQKPEMDVAIVRAFIRGIWKR